MTAPSAIVNISRNVGFAENVLAKVLAIAKAENINFDENALGDLTLVDYEWGPSVGLMQIRTLKPPYDAPEPYRSINLLQQLKQPQYNLYAAYKISKGGTYWYPWSTHRFGNYKKYLTWAQQVVDDTPPESSTNDTNLLLAAAAGITLAIVLTR